MEEEGTSPSFIRVLVALRGRARSDLVREKTVKALVYDDGDRMRAGAITPME